LVETKVLKQLVRDHIDPNRDLGHSDKHGKKKEEKTETGIQHQAQAQQTQVKLRRSSGTPTVPFVRIVIELRDIIRHARNEALCRAGTPIEMFWTNPYIIPM
jgi:hypothetical protein